MPKAKKGENRQLQGAEEFKGTDTEKEALDKIEQARLATEKEAGQEGTNGGPTPTLLDEAAWRRAANELKAETLELEELAERQAEVRGRISSIKKVAEKCGVDWDVVKLYNKFDARIRKGGQGEIVTEQRRLAALMRYMDSPLHTQFGMFPEEQTGNEANGAAHIAEPELAGQAAYRNSEPPENNPHQPGTLAHQEWSLGYHNAEAANARSMGPADGEGATH